jgi:hypothetical protein
VLTMLPSVQLLVPKAFYQSQGDTTFMPSLMSVLSFRESNLPCTGVGINSLACSGNPRHAAQT